MGALTESRKRLNGVFSSSPDYSIGSPVLKKTRFSPMPSTLKQNVSIHTSKSPVSRFRKFPPPLPLTRPVHAPQRNLKFLRSANSISNSQREANWGFEKVDRVFVGMGNVLGSIAARLKETKDSAFESVKLWKHGETVIHGDTNHLKGVTVEELGVEEYRNLVEKQEGHSIVSDYTDVGPPVNHALEEWASQSPVYKRLHDSSLKRDSKLSTLELQIRLTEAKRSAFKFIKVLPEEVKEDVAQEPFIPLKEAEIDDVSRALSFTSKRREILVVHESSNIEITRDILQCLNPGAWLNDEVINLYLELLKEREKRCPKKFLKCHFFNTFFYKKLISGRSGYDFKAVRRWTTQRKIGYDLIECDKIFVPVHKEIHWCLAVINIKDEKFQYLDSLRGRDTQALKVLARYLVDEVKDKNGKDFNISSWKQEFVNDLPEQLNGWDCGMFMIKYVDFYSRGLELYFTQAHMPYFRQRTAKEILTLKAE
ncbi:ubiquitin-like-specific protease ESD4 [Tasmannia lanceolata]|uniref:ubiquitin-like-specific protease ESD4 n=1 Tax=Tasmannia lanceolata TaxID=3420 RepID=UPI004063A756